MSKRKVTPAFRRKVMILRNNLVKLNPFCDSNFSTKKEWLSDLTTSAWAFVRRNYDRCFILRATTKKGERRSQLVFIDWNNYNTVKGTGRPIGNDRQLFVLIAAYITGIRSTRSYYKANIIQLAA